MGLPFWWKLAHSVTKYKVDTRWWKNMNRISKHLKKSEKVRLDWKGKLSWISDGACFSKEKLHIHPIYNAILPHYCNITGTFQNNTKQKQPSKSILWKRCSETMQEICRRTLMPIATLLKSHFGMGVLL